MSPYLRKVQRVYIAEPLTSIIERTDVSQTCEFRLELNVRFGVARDLHKSIRTGLISIVYPGFLTILPYIHFQIIFDLDYLSAHPLAIVTSLIHRPVVSCIKPFRFLLVDGTNNVSNWPSYGEVGGLLINLAIQASCYSRCCANCSNSKNQLL